MITVLLVVFPLLAAALMQFFRNERWAYLAAAVLAVVEMGLLYPVFGAKPETLIFQKEWLPNIAATFGFAIDGISMVLVALAVILMPLIILSTSEKGYNRHFYSLAFVMQSAMIGVFTATDGLLFYIFWELALIPIYFICLLWGGEGRGRITFKFFVYTLAGSLAMLVGMLYLYFNVPNAPSFAITDLYEAGKNLTLPEQTWVFVAFFFAFAIKIPIFPFHTWQPDTYTTAPTAGTMLLSGVMLKMGTYGVVRWLIPMLPQAYDAYASWAMWLCVIGVVYASCIAIVQTDFKRLIAYSSIAHVGLIAAGLFTMNEEGVQGAMVQMFAHGVNAVAMFYIVDLIETRMKTRQIDALGGIRVVAPVFAVYFLIVLLGSVALPLTNGFVGEFLLLNGIFQYATAPEHGQIALIVLAGLTVILGAVYMLRSYQGIMLGNTNELTATFSDLTLKEKTLLSFSVFLIIGMGIYPQCLLNMSSETVGQLLIYLQNALIK